MDARVGDKSLLIIYLAVQLTDAGTVTENVQWHIVNKVSTGRELEGIVEITEREELGNKFTDFFLNS